MRLLHAQTCRLRLFPDPNSRPSYLILSHVWQAHEWTFQDVDSLRGHPDPRALVSDKIRSFCFLAEREGFDWVWIDTCCVDKSSSAELSEAVNSMYLWYSQAVLCYAYLHDVSTDGHPAALEDRFVRSVWFTRGWTLQELLAPSCLFFLSCDWRLLGTKEQWADVIQTHFRIDHAVLTRAEYIHEVSIARRLSWAAGRRTTRPEDRAYSLMGLFRVHMPVVYGEGPTKAFHRLQAEILKQCAPDQSLFAWGSLDRNEAPTRPAYSLRDNTILDSEDGRLHLITSSVRQDLFARVEGGLLAPSPDFFAQAYDIEPISQRAFMRILGIQDAIEPPDVHLTGFAVRITLPLIEVPNSPRKLFLAPLLCQRRSDPNRLLYLYLRERPSKITKSLYVVGRDTPQHFTYSRGGVLGQVDLDVAIRLSTIFVLHNPDYPAPTIHPRLYPFHRPLPPHSDSAVFWRHSTSPLYRLYIPRRLLELSRLTVLTPNTPSAVIDGLEADVLYGEPGAELVLQHLASTDSASRVRSVSSTIIRFRLGAACPCGGLEPLWFTAAWRPLPLAGEVASSTGLWRDLSTTAIVLDAQALHDSGFEPSPGTESIGLHLCALGRAHFPNMNHRNHQTYQFRRATCAVYTSDGSVRPPIEYCPSGPMPYPSSCLQFGLENDFVYRAVFDDWPNRPALALHAQGGSPFTAPVKYAVSFQLDSCRSIGTLLDSTTSTKCGSLSEYDDKSDTIVSREDSPMLVDPE
ncbi:HET-domain-containing protein [Pilatotrama ljubarskyi]|nr:HET-domain-containing protein [Pilatotrama ljubarskyi]